MILNQHQIPQQSLSHHGNHASQVKLEKNKQQPLWFGSCDVAGSEQGWHDHSINLKYSLQ